MDSTHKPGSPTARARLRLPNGEFCSGRLAVKGARAVFFSCDDFLPGWPAGQTGHLFVSNANLDSSVALNGMVDGGLDLTLVDHLSAAQAAALGMPAEAPYDAEGARKLLATLVDLGQQQLDELVGAFLVDLGDRLFDRATASGLSASERQHYYDALNSLKQSSESLRGNFAERIAAAMGSFEKAQGEGSAGRDEDGELELVGFAEMEETLTLERMIKDAIERYRLDLEALTLRTGDLLALGGARVRTPFHPRVLCIGFDDALNKLAFGAEPLLEGLRLFQRNVVQRLTRFYLELNHEFARRGLRPGLEDELNAGGSILHRARENKPYVAERAAEDPDRGGDREPPAEPERTGATERRRRPAKAPAGNTAAAPLQPDLPTEAIYEALQHALAHRPRAPIEPPDGAGPAATPEELVALLAELQRQTPAEGEEGRDLGELVAERGATADAASGGQLAFVDRIFSGLARSGAVGSELRGSMERLRIPLARLALLDPKVFADPGHPAHRVVDKVSRLAAAENFPNPVLARKLDELTGRISSDYDGDTSVFERADSELEGLLLQQADAAERNIQRVIGGMEGQEKLRAARRAVTHLLDDSLAGDRVPRAFLDLLDAGLRDLLTQTAVREGIDSRGWQALAQQLEALLSALRDVDDGNSGPARARALQPELRALGDAISGAQPGNVGHETALREILDIAGGELPLETSPLPERQREDRPAIPDGRLADLPRLRRWLQRVDDLRSGTVMSYRGSDGSRRRMRLVWISDDRQRFAFVNDHGKKVAELSRFQLARKLGQGLKPPAPVDGMSLLHRGVFDTLAGAQEHLGDVRGQDTLTELANDQRLLLQLDRTVAHAQRHDALHAFLCLDIDAFHLVNELYEEVDGDQVLAEFARRLAQLHERRSLTGRLRDDQFGILLAYRDGDEALALAETIRGDIEDATIDVAGEAVRFTVSLGVAPITAAAESVEAVLGQAQTALGEAKAAGGNRCRRYAAGAPAEGADRGRERRRQAVELAIAEGRLELRAQPIVQRSTDDSQPASHHYEILLAVRDAQGEVAPPGDFIADAERANAMVLVDRWVINEVCAWISTLMDRQREVPQVAINLSGQSLRDDTFTDYVLDRLSEFGVGTSKVCFEITEEGAAENLTKTADFVRTLRNIGCKFSLDDFGERASSHDYLRQLPVDYVKIDGSFIRHVHENPADRAMVRAINDLAHFLGQETIAECVETLEAVEPLQEIGIDCLQGWGVGMPRSLEAVSRDLRPLET